MDSLIKTWKTNRLHYVNIIDRYNNAQLNFIPQGFNNNLIWHLGHVVVTQQSIIYKGCGLPMNIDDAMFEKYRPGSKPSGNVSDEEIALVKQLLSSLIVETEKDLDAGLFKQFQERTTGTGFHLGSVEDAFEFALYHEGLHMGYMRAMSFLIR